MPIRRKTCVVQFLLDVLRKPDLRFSRSPKVLASHFVFVPSSKNIKTSRQEWLDQACQYWRHHVESWTSREGVLVVRFEDIIKQPTDIIERIGSSFGIASQLASPVLPPRLRSKWHGRWYRLFATNSPSTEIMTPNQGAIFDNLFGGLDLSQFEQTVQPLMQKWGYKT